jgi:hypothetical protein
MTCISRLLLLDVLILDVLIRKSSTTMLIPTAFFCRVRDRECKYMSARMLSNWIPENVEV